MLAAEQSLKRLGTHHFDLYQVHWPNPAVPQEETLRAMEELVAQGKVRNVGVCNFTRDQLIDARADVPDLVISSVQSEYNIYQRHVEREMLPYCVAEGITLLAYSPLDSGLANFGDSRLQKLEQIAAGYKASVYQLILRWLLANEQVVVIVKTATISHLESNARSVEINISESDLSAIDDLFEQKVFDVNPRDVAVLQSDGYRYRTLEEAELNGDCLIPSPELVAGNTAKGYMLQPVGVRMVEGVGPDQKYALADNEQVYWSWRMAHGDGAPMPVYIKHGRS
jgi:diketogulonate reductase-like aldo/keto reductase